MPDSIPHKRDDLEPLVDLKLRIPASLYTAFHRCLWIRVNESGQTPLQLMEEVVVDFLKKHQC